MARSVMRLAAVVALVVGVMVSGHAAASTIPSSALFSSKTVVCDGITTGTVQLSQIDVTGLPSYATQAWVISATAWFDLVPNTGLPPDGSTIINANASDSRQWKIISSGGGAPSGPAGGSLAGTYPSPSLSSTTLTAIAGLSPVANKIPYATGSTTWALTDYSAAARAWDGAADVAAETALLNTFTSSLKGLAPASGGGTTNFLRADGTWATPAGGGTGINATTAESAAPGTPSAGNLASWADSTDHRFHDKNSSGTVATTVVASTCASHQWASSFSSAGVMSCAQPVIGDVTAFTSSAFAAVCSDETGSNHLVYSTNPLFDSYNSYTEVAAPALPTAGTQRCWADSTAHNLMCELSTGVVTHGMQTVACTSGQAVIGIADSGGIQCSATLSGITLNGTTTIGGRLSLGDNPVDVTPHNDGNKTGASPALADFSTTGNNHTWTLTGNVTGTPTWTIGNAKHFQVRVCQGASGGPYTMVWPSTPTLNWVGGSAPTLSTTASACDLIAFDYDGSTIIGQAASAGGGGSGITALTGDVTASGTGSVAATNVNAPDGFTQAGKIIETEIAAPATPATGKVSIWADSTDARFHDKNPAGTIATTVVASSCGSNTWVSSMSSAGVLACTQPAFSNLSGTGTCSQEPALTGDVTSSAGSCATTIAANAVTNSKMATMAANTVKANNTGSTATPTDVTMSALLTAIAALPLAGGTMSGAIAMGAQNITNVKDVSYVFATTSPSGASPVLADWTAGNVVTATIGAITGTPTFTAPTLGSGGGTMLRLRVKQDATGGRTISTWPTGVRWPNGAPTLPSAANAVFWITFIYDGTNYDGSFTATTTGWQ